MHSTVIGRLPAVGLTLACIFAHETKSSTNQAHVPAAAALTRTWFTPPVIPDNYAQPVRFEAEATGDPASVAFEYNGADRLMYDDGTHGDVAAGDGIWTILFPASDLVSKLTPAWVHRPFIGYCRPLGGGRYNIFADIWTPDVGVAAVTPLNSTAQRTDYVVNFVASSIDYVASAKRLFSFLTDSFDFLNYISIGSRQTFANRFHAAVKNDVSGIGVALFDASNTYGSHGQLKGLNVFPLANFFDGAATGFSHETGHQWINFVNGAHLASGIPHWPKGNIAINVMGFSIPPTGQGGSYSYTFTPNGSGGYVVGFNPAPNANTIAFNTMELYLMGLVPSADVSPFFVLNDQNHNVVDGEVLQPSDITSVSAADVIAAAGPRIPDSSASQKAFRVATILLSDQLLDAYSISLYDWFARRAEGTTTTQCSEGLASGFTCKPFYVATGGRATIAAGLADAAITFTDDPLISGSTVIRAAHVLELRSRIDGLRSRLGLQPFSWTDASLTLGSSVARAQHVLDLRTALSQAYVAAGKTAPPFGEPISIGATIKASHLTEIRSLLLAIL